MLVNLDRFEMVVKGKQKADPLKESVDALATAAEKIEKAVSDFNAKRKEPEPEEDPEPDTGSEPDNEKGVPGKD